jgi:LPS export ABC transporter protein LptC
MHKNKIFLLALASVFLAVFIWFFIVRHQHSSESVTAPMETVTSSTESAVTIKNITLREHEKKKGYELVVTAQESLLHPSSDVVECRGVTGTIIRYGTHVACVSAEKSVINRIDREIFFHGDVQGSFKDIFMHGADIVYNFATQKVRTDRTITYTHPFFQMTANKSRVDVSTQKIVLSGGVSSLFLYCAATNKSGK